ncbi:uncharacterized protein LOC133816692 [Humulus lupulus]|nr:uncharacterized protein LOC133816692 [Humulus lupulus]
MKYSTTQGTKSLAATRHEKLNPNLIEEWKEYHWTKKNKSFVNEDAERDYVKLKSTLEAETQQTVESGTDDSSSVDQMKILSQVLGERRGHQRGVGRTLKGK